jgi:hypothetical protein
MFCENLHSYMDIGEETRHRGMSITIAVYCWSLKRGNSGVTDIKEMIA